MHMQHTSLPPEYNQPCPRHYRIAWKVMWPMIAIYTVGPGIILGFVISFVLITKNQNVDNTIHFRILGWLYAAIVSLYMFSLLSRYLRERKLVKWGRAVHDTILSEEEHFVGRGIRTTHLTYQFRTDDGMIVEGVCKGLPSKKEMENEKSHALLTQITDNPTVLYDPNRSSKNMMCPPSLVVCCVK